MSSVPGHGTRGPRLYTSSNAASSFSSQSDRPPHNLWEEQTEAWVCEADKSYDRTKTLEKAAAHFATAPLGIHMDQGSDSDALRETGCELRRNKAGTIL